MYSLSDQLIFVKEIMNEANEMKSNDQGNKNKGECWTQEKCGKIDKEKKTKTKTITKK